ncbi:MAG: hypothetical protein ACI8R4_002685 [Paracoccaceae bacterium]|jgi:hypothetical protein
MILQRFITETEGKIADLETPDSPNTADVAVKLFTISLDRQLWLGHPVFGKPETRRGLW